MSKGEQVLWYDSRARDHSAKFSTWNRSKLWSNDETTLTFVDLKSLQTSLVGSVVLTGDPDYDQARMLSNPRFSAFPVIIIYCEVDSDVATCLSWARMRKLPVVIRSGGFSAQNGFLIDVSRLNDVIVDVSERTVWAGPGTTFRKFSAKIEAFVLHTPGGACPDVCFGGYMQGGGYGFTPRIFGMNCGDSGACDVSGWSHGLRGRDDQHSEEKQAGTGYNGYLANCA